ncbi:MAG: hypothetical protein IKQ33_03750 [Clostridia bacterium]|nr:hypothetical protein [Clostridia bacterium]
MNQILVTDVENNNNKSHNMKPIIRFFCVVAIIFALILIAEGGFYLYKRYVANKKEEDQTKKDGQEVVIPEKPEEPKDTTNPTISIKNANGKLTVTVTDETELDYFVYQWEGKEENRIEATEETKTTIEQEIFVEKGTSRLTLTAVDKAGNKETTTKKIIGSNGPTITASISNENFVVKVTDEFGITKIEYSHNGGETQTVEGIPEGAKEYEFKVPLTEGTNYLKINAYENGIMTEYKCKKTR